jgi:flavin-dependent dehydrogenase
MDACEVLIVGGGPAGSACAWRLGQSGLETIILDKQIFPRDKICGGWITPPVLGALEIDRNEYAPGRVFQSITAFRTSCMGEREVETMYGEPISYGIRRVEFDNYLLRRSGARVFEGVALASLERFSDHWVVNGQIKARIVVGAGGHFCPVARFMGADARKEVAVVAQETEFELSPPQRADCSIQGEVPELYFCPDMKGYGWCFRKGNFLNIGLGRLDAHAFPRHVHNFTQFLKCGRKIGIELPSLLHGHAYLLYRYHQRKIVGDSMLLVGDSAGLAYSQSGEGIRTAVESGLLAADVILSARGEYNQETLNPYPSLLASHFGEGQGGWSVAIGRRVPASLLGSLAKLLLASRWFSRRVVLDQWFLHRRGPALRHSGWQGTSDDAAHNQL